MKNIHKLLAMILCITMLAIPISATGNEVSIAYAELVEQTKQDEIDEICAELNELALNKYKVKSEETYSLKNDSLIRKIDLREKTWT